MMHAIEEITKKLPGIDCGSCGAPTCMAFAEDIVKKETCADECTVIMRRILRKKGIGKALFYSETDIPNCQCNNEENDDDGK